MKIGLDIFDKNKKSDKPAKSDITYKCEDCQKQFSEEDFKKSGGFCPDCKTGMLRRKEESKAEGVISPPTRGDCGLGILILDFSSSMREPAFGENQYKEYPQKKIDLVSRAIGYSLPKMRNIGKAENAYVAIIGFANEAKLLEIKKASEIEEEAGYWIDWTARKQEETLKSGDGTNISGALKLALDIYGSALKGKMENFGLKNFSLMYHDMDVGGKIVPVANVRVFLYSDGDHNVGPFINHFKNTSLVPGKSNISGLITAYFGTPNVEGYKLLENIAGACPKHNVKGIMHIISPEVYPRLRSTFHMASAASGFCAECAKEFTL